jgi:CRP-like cAMP-binding protein
MELLRGLSDEQQVHYREGATIVQTGQTGTRMYVVLEGRVAISIGKRVVERLGPGGVFGEAALLEPSPRLATATAETDCELLPVTRRGFLALVKLNPGFADAILTSIAERLRFLTSGMK